MKLTSIFLLTIVAIAILFVPKVLAFDPFNDTGTCSPGSADATVCQENQQSGGQTTTDNRIYGPNGVITKVANLISILIGVVSVIIIILAGLRLITSSGDAAKLTQSRNAIIYALVGIVVTVFSQAIIIFVLNKL